MRGGTCWRYRRSAAMTLGPPSTLGTRWATAACGSPTQRPAARILRPNDTIQNTGGRSGQRRCWTRGDVRARCAARCTADVQSSDTTFPIPTQLRPLRALERCGVSCVRHYGGRGGGGFGAWQIKFGGGKFGGSKGQGMRHGACKAQGDGRTTQEEPRDLAWEIWRPK